MSCGGWTLEAAFCKDAEDASRFACIACRSRAGYSDCAGGAWAIAEFYRALLGRRLERRLSFAHGLPSEVARRSSSAGDNASRNICAGARAGNTSSLVEGAGHAARKRTN